jgi:hypothetical protein
MGLFSCQQNPATSSATTPTEVTDSSLMEGALLPASDSLSLDTLLQSRDTVHPKRLYGIWKQPVEGVDSLMQGFEFKSDGKMTCFNMHHWTFTQWSISVDTLILKGHLISQRDSLIRDTLHIATLLTDTLWLHPQQAAPGYLEVFFRERKRKK